ncbi:MAG: adenylate/guanylate cyclase domain-containing protein [Actinomycetota bacterium]
MGVTCPSCGSANPDGARFCSSCGAPLSAEPAARKERKFATVLFADLVGSTALGEREDPEVVQELVGRSFDRMSEVIGRYEGVVEKFVGDAILAAFGVPSAHEDDPERAVRSALEMQAVMSEVNRAFASEGRTQLAMRIGIDGGEVLVDLERAGSTRERMLTGDAVNTASRLEAVAEPGRVVVGQTVYRATKDIVDYRELSPLHLKGKPQPVTAWEALRVRAPLRGERVPLGLEARLVGRDEEMAVLKQSLHRVEREGRPALVTILGSAGVGKSRLVWELSTYVEGLAQSTYWRRGRCLPYGNLSYSGLADAAKAQCEILEDDPPEVVTEKTERAVADLFGEDAPSVAGQISTLVGAPAEGTFSREDLFDAWRRFLERMAARYPLVLVIEDIHWADEGLLDFIEHLADWGQGPIFILTLARPELLETRGGWGGGRRNYAAIHLEPLGREETAAMVDDLVPEAMPAELKELVVGRSEGIPLFAEEIVRMFIDRGVLRLDDSGRWEVPVQDSDVEIPPSIHALIAARLDTLPPEEKAILQDASVVGRVFWLGAVGRLSGRGAAEARYALGQLRVKEIIVPREPPTFSGELEFGFRHVLIRDVAYQSLPKASRGRKHAEVARWAEDRAGERRTEMAELLATHYTESLRYAEEVGDLSAVSRDLLISGYRWTRAAGDRATRLWQAAQTIAWYRKALDLAPAAEVRDDDLLALWAAYVNASFRVESRDVTAKAAEEALRVAERIDDNKTAGRMETVLATLAFYGGRDEESLARFDRAIGILDPLGDSIQLAETLQSLGMVLWRRDRLADAVGPLRKSLEVSTNVGDDAALANSMMLLASVVPTWEETVQLHRDAYRLSRNAGDLLLFLRAANNLASALRDVDPDLSQGEALLKDALEISRRSGHPYEGWLLGTLSEYMLDRGDLIGAKRLSRESRRLAKSSGEGSAAAARTLVLAEVELERGRIVEAEESLGEALSVLEETPEHESILFIALIRSDLADARGDAEEALRLRLEALKRAGPNPWTIGGDTLWVGATRGLMRSGSLADAEALRERIHGLGALPPRWQLYDRWVEGLMATDPTQAVSILEGVLARFEGLGFRLEQGRCLLDLAEAQQHRGTPHRETLKKARRIFAECGAELYVRRANEALAKAGR